jgi:hypothetical protein
MIREAMEYFQIENQKLKEEIGESKELIGIHKKIIEKLISQQEEGAEGI